MVVVEAVVSDNPEFSLTGAIESIELLELDVELLIDESYELVAVVVSAD